MTESSTTLKQRPITDKQSDQSLASGPSLAAALTAALLDYQQYVEHRNGHTQPPGAGDSWRLMGRIEQLKA
jgi:hypothetical protein